MDRRRRESKCAGCQVVRATTALAPRLLAATIPLLAAATHRCADVAELADALDSKSGTRKSVWVRPPPSAPTLLLFVFALAEALQHGEARLFCVGNGERFEFAGRCERGNDFAHRLFARRTPGQFRRAQRPAQRELPTANCAITFAEFVLVKRHTQLRANLMCPTTPCDSTPKRPKVSTPYCARHCSNPARSAFSSNSLPMNTSWLTFFSPGFQNRSGFASKIICTP